MGDFFHQWEQETPQKFYERCDYFSAQKKRWRKKITYVAWMGFSGGSAGKESTCNVGDLGSIPGLGRSLEKRKLPTPVFLGFPCDLAGKESACNAGDLGSIPGLGRSPGEGKATHSSILAWRNPWTV